jgi:hypothetical protein
MMKLIPRELLIVLICLSLGFCLSYFILPRHGERVYNCELAEISPDIPAQVKEECRKHNLQRGLWVPK